MLTREELDHLCMLTALQLPDEEKARLLPQLSALLDFVGHLDQCVLDHTREEDIGSAYIPTPLSNEGSRSNELLTNIRHEINTNMPLLQTGLAK